MEKKFWGLEIIIVLVILVVLITLWFMKFNKITQSSVNTGNIIERTNSGTVDNNTGTDIMTWTIDISDKTSEELESDINSVYSNSGVDLEDIKYEEEKQNSTSWTSDETTGSSTVDNTIEKIITETENKINISNVENTDVETAVETNKSAKEVLNNVE